MATMFMAIGSALGGGGAAAGATAAGVAGSTGAATLGLSKGLTIFRALTTIAAGAAASSAAKDAANEAKVQEYQEEALGASQARTLAKDYEKLVAEQQVVQIANGVNPAIGTARQIREATSNEANRDLSLARDNTAMRMRIARRRRRGLMSEARASLIGGFGSGAGILAEGIALHG